MRKDNLEPAMPSDSSADSDNKYVRWRRAVEELLTAKWQRSADVASVAATVVGMFDAGASEEEVAFFLRSHELQDEEEALLTVESRIALARELHRCGALPLSTRPPDEES